MHIKERFHVTHFWSAVIFLGLILLATAVGISYHICKLRAEDKLLRIVNYMKVQCATYTHYNNGAETQALLRAIESNRQMIADIARADSELNRELLKQYAERLWLQCVVVLDANGNKLCSYAEDAQTEQLLLENYNQDTVFTGNGYPQRSYAQRIYLGDNSYINMAAGARENSEGMVLTCYRISAECAQTYSLTLQSLLDGYQIALNGTIMVTDAGSVVACNDKTQIGQNTANSEVVQALKEYGSSKHITRVSQNHSYGVMLKQRDYYIFAYISEKNIFSSVPLCAAMVLIVYICMVGVMGIQMMRSNRDHLRKEMKQEAEYKKGLQEAVAKADAANAAKTRFLQRMSHDIRTPINGICGMLEVGDYYANDLEKQTECRRKVKGASRLLLELINEVLDMGKLESGEIVFMEQPFNLHEIIDEVLVVIEKLASEQQITLIPEDFQVLHWNLIGSAAHVKRLLMNILSNAVKYNKPNGTITVQCRELTSRGQGTAVLEFVCADTGIGMSEEYQKKIFEPFTQEDSGVQSRYGGSGLGMPIAKGLVDKMGGTLTFESKEGVGSIFVVTIPFKIDTKATEQHQPDTLDEKPSVAGYHILIAEDNELNMEIAEFQLQKEDASTVRAWTGKEAVEIFERARLGEFDAILMDMMMPDMDGCQAAAAIRAMDRADAKTIPIIAMTANAFTEDRLRTKNAGMNAHLAKPLDSELLIETLARLVKNKPQ